jgi:hypothetical protein
VGGVVPLVAGDDARHLALAAELHQYLGGELGAIAGDAPVFERFYGGGLGSIRGFEFRGVSPRQGLRDDRVGGDFLALLDAEYSFPIVGEILRGVLFVDSGTVEKNIEVTSYVGWRIADPKKYLERIGTRREDAEARLRDIVYSELGKVLGGVRPLLH